MRITKVIKQSRAWLLASKRTPARCALQKGLRITKRAEPIADRRRADRGAVAGRPRHNRVPSTARYRRAIAIYIHSTTTISMARAYIQISAHLSYTHLTKSQKPRALKSWKKSWLEPPTHLHIFIFKQLTHATIYIFQIRKFQWGYNAYIWYVGKRIKTVIEKVSFYGSSQWRYHRTAKKKTKTLKICVFLKENQKPLMVWLLQPKNSYGSIGLNLGTNYETNHYI